MHLNIQQQNQKDPIHFPGTILFYFFCTVSSFLVDWPSKFLLPQPFCTLFQSSEITKSAAICLGSPSLHCGLESAYRQKLGQWKACLIFPPSRRDYSLKLSFVHCLKRIVSFILSSFLINHGGSQV